MLLGVISDTHGDLERTRAAMRMFDSLEVDLVIHCGDIGTEEIVPLLAAWPTHYVFGNCDCDRAALRRAIEAAGQTCHDLFGTLELAGRRIAWLHGDDSRLLRESIASQEWDLLCHGHTHVVREEISGKTLILNPGAVHRARPPSIATVELPERIVNVVPI